MRRLFFDFLVNVKVGDGLAKIDLLTVYHKAVANVEFLPVTLVVGTLVHKKSRFQPVFYDKAVSVAVAFGKVFHPPFGNAFAHQKNLFIAYFIRRRCYFFTGDGVAVELEIVLKRIQIFCLQIVVALVD